MKKKKYKSDPLGLKNSQKKLKQTTGLVVGFGVAQMMVATAKGLK